MPYNGFKYFSTPWTHHTPHWLHASSNCPTPSFHIEQFNDFKAIRLKGGMRKHHIPPACLHLLFANLTSLPSPTHVWLNNLFSTPFHRPFLTHHHVVVGVVIDGEEVRGNFVAFLPLVDLGHFSSIDGQPVWVDRHTEEAWVGLQVEGNMRRFEGCDEMIGKLGNVSTNQVDIWHLYMPFLPFSLPVSCLSNPCIETLNRPGCVLYVRTAFKGVFHKCSI